MPTISQFLGMTIRMYFADHAPPHFHVEYNEHEAQICIADLSLLRGSLPKRAMALAIEWAALHRQELADNWALCAGRHPPRKIEPLES